jgi:hypothetical protein
VCNLGLEIGMYCRETLVVGMISDRHMKRGNSMTLVNLIEERVVAYEFADQGVSRL